jgi:8-amino-7-oxononanoate synthase
LFGSTGSRLLDGTTPHHLALERRLASFFGSESALLFSSGWDANVSFFSTVPQRGDWILFDELIHASVWDGMRSSRVSAASRRPIKHNNVESLKSALEAAIFHDSWKSSNTATTSSTSPSVIYIAVESLYSMDGDLACLPQMVSTVKQVISQNSSRLTRSQVCFVVDEAHTTGVYGNQGRGFVNELGTDVEEWVDVRLMTFGKGVGSQGGVSKFVCVNLRSCGD